MEPKKIKGGASAINILAIVFTIIGVVFAAIGVITASRMDALKAHGTGNVEVIPIVFGAVGLPFLILGIIFIVLTVRKRSMMKRVVSAGYYVMADVVSIRRDYSVEVNGVCPCALECHYKDPTTGTLHVFRSRDLFFYPAELEGKQIRVYVEQGNMSHYYVDVESVVPDIQVH